MNNEKILIIGGTFNNEGGIPSDVIPKLFEKLQGAMIINGGLTDFLTNFINEGIKDYQLIYYLPDKLNEDLNIEKIKKENPKCLIISSKDYSDKEIDAVCEFSNNNEEILVSLTNKFNYEILKEVTLDEASKFVVGKDSYKKLSLKKINSSQESIIELERLHLRVSDDTIDILYRPNHNYIAFVPNDDNGKAEVKRLATMSRDEFAGYLKTKFGMPRLVKTDIPKLKESRLEEWYLCAWKLQTDALFKELKITNPIEEPIWKE